MELNAPKYAQETLTIRNNYYVVHRNGRFFYYPLRPNDATLGQPVMRLEKRPPILLEGLAIIEKKPYFVPMKDLLRGVVRKSNLISTGRANAASRTTTARNTAPSGGSSSGSSSSTDTAPPAELVAVPSGFGDIEQQSAIPAPELEELQAADLAWEEQTRTLLEALHQKEGGEWELAPIVQPGQPNAGGPVQDPNQGT